MANFSEALTVMGIGLAAVFLVMAGLAAIIRLLYGVVGGDKLPEHEAAQKTAGPNMSEIAAVIATTIHQYRGQGDYRIIRISHEAHSWSDGGRQMLVSNVPHVEMERGIQ